MAITSTGEGEHIVLIEDDTSNREAFRRALERAGYRVSAFESPDQGLEELSRAGDVALVVTDLMMPGKDGMFVLSEARRIDPDIGLLMVTARDSATMGFEASQKGADDYLVKDQFDLSKLRHTVQAILEKRRLKQEVTHLRRRIESESLGGLIGRTPSMQRLYQQIQMVAPTRSTVLIVGDSGTGKELVANAIHEHSPRRQERFLPINCGAIPSEILESELFGHEKGSFTGAASRKIGKFEMADRGTIFLDEIAELPPDMQVKLLRVLEGMEFMRVGGGETIRVDVRVIAATNVDLETAVAGGRFRSDLYYRLKVVTIRIPPLRERREDIPILVQTFLQRFAAENRRPELTLTPAALRALVMNPWEGNVRELKNVVESLVVLSTSTTLDLPDLPPEYQNAAAASRIGPGGGGGRGEGSGFSEVARPEMDGGAGRGLGGDERPRTMEEIERDAILRTLDEVGGNRTQAAQRLGIGLRTLQRKLQEYRRQSGTTEG